MAKHFVTKRYNGDDCYSWAVFRKKDVRGCGSIVFPGQATPVISGLSRFMAQQEARSLDAREGANVRS